MGAECLSSYGGLSFTTPRIDALARGGLRFTSCFATPACTPSRVQLLTGRYPFRTGWTDIFRPEKDEGLDPGKEITLARLLRDSGYATAVAGKWHLGDLSRNPDHPRELGFQESCLWMGDTADGAPSRYFDPSILENGRAREDVRGRYGPDVFNEFLVDFMGRHRDRPFFAYYAMVLPHAPFHVPPGLAGVTPEHSDLDRFGAMMLYADALVGKIVDALAELGLGDRTLVLVTADNGTPEGLETRLGNLKIPGGKRRLDHFGAWVPLIASGAGIDTGPGTAGDLVDFSDILPTVCELAGVEIPRDRVIDGRSFAHALRGESGPYREYVFVQQKKRCFLRTAGWALRNNGRIHDLERDAYLLEPRDPSPDDPERVVTARAELQGMLDTLLGGLPLDPRGEDEAAGDE
jgi:arylsulfatase A